MLLKGGQARTRPSTRKGCREAHAIDWAHVRDLAERTKGPRDPGPELVITAGYDGGEIAVDQAPEVEDVVRQG